MKPSNFNQPAKGENKEPWLAVNLSLFFPGIGQIYAGKPLKGIILIVIQASLILIAAWSIFSPTGNTVTGISFLAFIVVIYILNLFDAHNSIKKNNPQKANKPSINQSPTYLSFTLHRSSAIKDFWFAVFLSQILPGIGHLYIEKIFLGGVFLISIIIFSNLSVFFWPLRAVTAIISAIACYHVYLASPKKSRKSRQLIKQVVIAIIIFKLTAAFLPILIEQQVEKFTIPSNSMLPTLQPGDKIFVHQSNNYIPQQGDLIVFNPPQANRYSEANKNEFFVKRVIGKPGETVQISNGVVYINNKPLKEDYIAESAAYQWGPVAVPAGNYLVLGDNRNDSFDSHAWGFLPAGNIIGKVYKIYWPPARIQPLN
ncbi:MAG: signal peptidase I [Microcoleus vaginatus WJT46-NPBG5]|jgi:signal peptidase I|nr:signal peptidase I [Microcoleus vaginatus WJT46-NPBG5]